MRQDNVDYFKSILLLKTEVSTASNTGCYGFNWFNYTTKPLKALTVKYVIYCIIWDGFFLPVMPEVDINFNSFNLI